MYKGRVVKENGLVFSVVVWKRCWGGEIAVVSKGGSSVESPEVGRIKTAITLHHGTLSRRLRCRCKGCTITN